MHVACFFCHCITTQKTNEHEALSCAMQNVNVQCHAQMNMSIAISEVL